MTSLLHVGSGLRVDTVPRTSLEVRFARSFVAYGSTRQESRQTRMCAGGGGGGGLGGGFGRCLGRAESECKGVARRSSAGDGAREVERLASIGGGSGGGSTGDRGRGGSRGGGGGGGHESGGDGGGQPLELPAPGLWSRYTELLDRHPLIVKSLTSGLLNALADFICQILVERGSAVDLRRLISFVAIGVFMSGPGLHFWYGMLSKFITVPGMGGAFLRTAADQLVFTPLGVIGFFVVLLNLEGRQTELAGKLQKDAVETVLANWKVWIPFQIINFGFVPPQLQVAAAGILGMVWSVFISYKGHT